MTDTKAGEVVTGEAVRCDFCGRAVDTVRRVALDGEYERLRTPHVERYACQDCFEEKDKARLAAPGGSGGSS